ncbi:hypothetical protein GCM10028806_58800 [Spirosoma terrae]|uniref:Virulence-associated e family protein n=1 Tax=Spirosoma terrae TaxID=1968276 RepID=A0A6L9LQH9_9BACT|nr:VapE domain-containing protein [Spirosoma terrae]NDU99219.1 virulence-associated e family protein [Spirosoma terrae]
MVIEDKNKLLVVGDIDKSKEIAKVDNQFEQIERFLSRNYSFRYNIVKGHVECLNTENNRYEPVTDRIEYSILRNVRRNQIKCDGNTLRSILLSDFSTTYDPFLSYFKELTKWDGTDHIQSLADTVVTTNSVLWEKCLRKWLVASVASLLNPRVVNQTVIVFSGKQGLGKTTWMEKLVPESHKDYLFSGTVNPGNKDTLINLAECWLINLDELENLNRTEIGSLKEMITKSNIRIRRPYGHNNENLARRASFVGSVNGHQFLTDTTGSRRFLCFEVNDIQHQHAVNINQVYAQALQLYRDGFQYWFDKDETAEIEKSNDQYHSKSVEEELLLTYFKYADNENAKLYLTTTQLIQHLIERGVRIDQRATRTMGMALHKHEFKRLKKGGVYVYALNERSDVEIAVDTQKERAIAPEDMHNTILISRN